MRIRLRLAIAAGMVVVGAARVAGQDALAAARDLYAAAAYEDALTALERARAEGGDQVRIVDQYRAFCLLALGRAGDAQQAIEAVVAAQPLYQPSDEDVSPRVRAAFTDVRRRMLPGIVQQTYAVAKAAYDRKDYAEAAGGFKQVLAVLAEPDLAAAAAQPPLSDIRVLAGGFHELSAAAAAPPPPPPPAPVPVAAPEPAVPAPPRIYTSADPDIVPPTAIRQVLPPFTVRDGMRDAIAGTGTIEVVIDELGRVEYVAMRTPVHPVYDRAAITAARSWQYQPAMLKGVPVKYRKLVQVSVAPRR
jgi:TonB family protein